MVASLVTKRPTCRFSVVPFVVDVLFLAASIFDERPLPMIGRNGCQSDLRSCGGAGSRLRLSSKCRAFWRSVPYESPEGSCEIRNSRYEIRDRKCKIRDTPSLRNHVHAHYDVPKTKDGGCCGGDVTGLRHASTHARTNARTHARMARAHSHSQGSY